MRDIAENRCTHRPIDQQTNNMLSEKDFHHFSGYGIISFDGIGPFSTRYSEWSILLKAEKYSGNRYPRDSPLSRTIPLGFPLKKGGQRGLFMSLLPDQFASIHK